MVALCEGLALGTESGLQGSDILDVLKESAIASPMYGLKGPKMLNDDFATNFPLMHQQKDIRLAVALGDDVGQPLPLASAANEIYKSAKASGHSEADFSAVF